MYYSQSARLAIYAQGEFGKSSKSAEGVLRYGKNPVVAVVDSTQAGKTVREVTGISSDVPIVATLAEALALKPDALLLGTASFGGHMNPQWRPDILAAINAKLDVINGLHDFLTNDAEIVEAAKSARTRLIDVRRPPDELPIASGKAVAVNSYVVLTVGSDCTVGKMTVSLELHKSALARGKISGFVATGQTGIMIAGEGISVDRVIGDFMSGAVEQMVIDSAAKHEFVFVEGQGSLSHPAFSGVTLAILHGSCPHALIFCHNPSRSRIKGTDLPYPSLAQQIKTQEDMSAYLRPAKVVGIALNTHGMDEKAAQQAIKEVEQETGLPATDAVRYGADKLFDAILAYKEKTLCAPVR